MSTSKKTFAELELNETLLLGQHNNISNYAVTKVPGGWLYRLQDNDISVYVPEPNSKVCKHDSDYPLRKLLWIRHGCEITAHDGEMQCSKCGIDFLRDDPEKIGRLMQRKST